MEYGALAIVALVDGSKDEQLRFEGAMLIAGLAQDMHLLKRTWYK